LCSGAAADLPQQIAVTDDRPSVQGQKPDDGYLLTQQSVSVTPKAAMQAA
jgi:hypothetical protein